MIPKLWLTFPNRRGGADTLALFLGLFAAHLVSSAGRAIFCFVNGFGTLCDIREQGMRSSMIRGDALADSSRILTFTFRHANMMPGAQEMTRVGNWSLIGSGVAGACFFVSKRGWAPPPA